MSATELRKAAEKLRALTAAEDLTPGPWYCDESQTVKDGRQSSHPVAETWKEPDAPYIAAMHPGVGIALADWLVSTADGLEARGVTARVKPAERDAITVARLINGGAA